MVEGALEKAWLKILQKYKGIHETMDTNFWLDFHKITASGLGQQCVDINEVNCSKETTSTAVRSPAPTALSS